MTHHQSQSDPQRTLKLELAKVLNVDIMDDDPDTSLARITEAFHAALSGRPVLSATGRQIEYAASMGGNVSRETKEVASIIIGRLLFEREGRALDHLALKPGDKVQVRRKADVDGVCQEYVTEHVVSSIQPNRRIMFKGGCGQGAWPTEVEKAVGQTNPISHATTTLP